MTVIACPHRGRKNRSGPRSHGVRRRGTCHNLLPWIADATPSTLEAEIAAWARDRPGEPRAWLDRHLTLASKV
jgi:hypothetical protein